MGDRQRVMVVVAVHVNKAIFSNVFLTIRKKNRTYGLGGAMPLSPPSSLLMLPLLPPLVLLQVTGDG